MDWTDALTLARRLAAGVDAILPADPLAEQFASVAAAAGWERQQLGTSAGGHAIEAWTTPGQGPVTLWYGFPDPGEAVGGTALLALAGGIAAGVLDLPVRWALLPVANRDDQPAGDALVAVRKTAAQEIDWCVADPRPETTALLQLAELQPTFTFPLHDEFHDGIDRPLYLPVSEAVPTDVAAGIAAIVRTTHALSDEFDHPTMGPGFFEMATVPDYGNSTFSRFARSGLVLICEVSASPDRSPADLVATQLAVGLFALSQRLGA